MSSRNVLFIPELDFSHTSSTFVHATDVDLSPRRTSDDWTDASSTSTVKLSKVLPIAGLNHTDTVNRSSEALKTEASTNTIHGVTVESPQRRPRNKLVKRSPKRMVDRQEVAIGPLKESSDARAFVCDIYALNSQTYREIEARCRALIIEAGGTILSDHFLHPGGFLYELPLASSNPLTNSTEILESCKISISSWKRFPELPLDDASKDFHCKIGGAHEIGSAVVVSGGPPRRQRASSGEGTKTRISSWLSGLARDYGGAIDYLH